MTPSLGRIVDDFESSSLETTGRVSVPDDVHAAALLIRNWAASNMTSSDWRLHGLCPAILVDQAQTRVDTLEARLLGRSGFKEWLADLEQQAGQRVDQRRAQRLYSVGTSLMDAVVALTQ